MKSISFFTVVLLMCNLVYSKSGVKETIKTSSENLDSLHNNDSATNYINATTSQTYLSTQPSTTSATNRCPQKCTCTDDGLVDCTKAGKTEIPSINELPVNTKIIDLKFNQIMRLSRFDLMFNLTKLILSHNLIIEVEPDVFQSVPNLKELDLSFNDQIVFPSKLLAPLHSLEKLKLTRCNLSKLDADFFEKNEHLKYLYLDSNPFVNLLKEEDKFLKYLGSLEFIDLTNTKLEQFIIGQATPLNRLQTLILSENKLDHVPFLKYAPNIETLVLDYNKIGVLNKQSFADLQRLRTLHLSHNDDLLDVEELTFAQQINLRELVLSNNNNLFLISQHAFYGMYNETHFPLKELNLQKNSLHFMSENLLTNRWGSLESLDLRLNPWNCDCHMQWLHKYKLNRNVTEIRCKFPDQHTGKRLIGIEPEDMVCLKLIDSLLFKKLKIVIQGFILILCFLVFTLAFLLIYVIRDRRYDWMRLFGQSSTGTIYYQKANTKELPILA